jgi:hypothetical protein
MAKFNATKTSTVEATKTINLAGGEAYAQSAKLEFVSHLLTSFVGNQFYRTEDEGIKTLKNLIANISDNKFLAKAAIFARNEYGMRSVTHIVAAELAKKVKGESWTKEFFNKVVFRPDDMTEILAYYMSKYGKPVPNSLKKGLALAFEKFDAYQIGKYRKENGDISLVDVVNIVHPKATPVITSLVKGTLKSKDTWEASLSKAGQEASAKAETAEEREEIVADLKKDAWTEMVKSRKIGYMALLKNLRNILQNAPDAVDEACAMLVEEKLVKTSKVLPFRFTTAMKEIEEIDNEGTRKIVKAINKAIDISLSNVPKFPGKTLVVVDNSGSMEGKPIEIASLFAAVIYKATDADMMVFSDNANYIKPNPDDSTVTIAKNIKDGCQSAGTNFHAIFNAASKKYDRIIILSDMQGWMGHYTPKVEFEAYKSKHAATPYIYSWDLAGQGTMQFPEKNVVALAGFSDKVFDIMGMVETDKNALIKRIEAVVL